MKRKLCCLLLAALLTALLALPAFADDGDNSVDYNGGSLNSSFPADALAETVNAMQPGDSAAFTVTLRNSSNVETDWYMLNDVTQTMEQDTAATGGAYTYQLDYKTADGTQLLYSSDRVNGTGAVSGQQRGEAGLSEAVGSLKDYFYLDTLAPGETAQVVLTVGLDGETQGNVYQGRDARLLMNFAVEESAAPAAAGEGGTRQVIVQQLRRTVTAAKTNDGGNLGFWLVMLLVSAALVAGLLVFGSKKHGKGGVSRE